MTESAGQVFEEVYKRVYPLVVRTVYLVVFDASVTEEIAHEAFLRLWQQRDKLRKDTNEKAWVMRVAVNLAIDHKRHVLRSLLSRFAPPPLPDPASIAIERIAGKHLRDGFARLRPASRAVLALRYDQGLSFPEIAEVMGEKETTVKVRHHRALAELRKQIANPNRLDAASPALEEIS